MPNKRQKTIVTLNLDADVITELDARADGLNQGGDRLVSRSSLANYALRKYLGIPVSETMEALIDE